MKSRFIQKASIFFSHSCLLFLVTLFIGCNSRSNKPPLFQVLDSKRTGLDFINKLTFKKDFNLFKYMYFYNGSGVGAGDFNNDGLVDLFFASNQQQNKLYLNQGKLKFKDVTKYANIPQDSAWSTGVSVVDINNDGLLDIYVCRVGNYETLRGKNQLLICQGIDKNGVPFYKDEAREYGLDFSGFSTQAAFFDYDRDGDLDMFLLNHSVHENGTFPPVANLQALIIRFPEIAFTEITVIKHLQMLQKKQGLTALQLGMGWAFVLPISTSMGIPIFILTMIFMKMITCILTKKTEPLKKKVSSA